MLGEWKDESFKLQGYARPNRGKSELHHVHGTNAKQIAECVKNGETKNKEKLASKNEQKFDVAANRFGGGEAAPKTEVSHCLEQLHRGEQAD